MNKKPQHNNLITSGSQEEFSNNTYSSADFILDHTHLKFGTFNVFNKTLKSENTSDIKLFYALFKSKINYIHFISIMTEKKVNRNK